MYNRYIFFGEKDINNQQIKKLTATNDTVIVYLSFNPINMDAIATIKDKTEVTKVTIERIRC